ncbi:unnamed protein product [Cuscuta epithymum]|uniref:Uncharacterized protein n=1 Tax=Cuscuta epithymum TaxID=186058 RepID=A0AAV0FEC8_9ASTE|nr:unnamed protein product [Cuscuta epithymum]
MKSINNSAATISANINSISVLNGTSFKEWKENVMIVLGCLDLNLALRTEKPATVKDTSTLDEKREMERWERSNRMSLMIMKRAILESFRGTMSDEADAKPFLAELEKRFAKKEKAEISTLLSTLVSMKYKGKGNIREYIWEMSHIASKLSALKLILPEELLVYLVLISLPSQFNQLKVSYNCIKEKWSLNELISHCVQEEERIKQDKTESAHLASTSKGNKKRKIKEVVNSWPQRKHHKETKEETKESESFFCKGTNHKKKKCAKYHPWRAKKGDGERVEVEAIDAFR